MVLRTHVACLSFPYTELLLQVWDQPFGHNYLHYKRRKRLYLKCFTGRQVLDYASRYIDLNDIVLLHLFVEVMGL